MKELHPHPLPGWVPAGLGGCCGVPGAPWGWAPCREPSASVPAVRGSGAVRGGGCGAAAGRCGAAEALADANSRQRLRQQTKPPAPPLPGDPREPHPSARPTRLQRPPGPRGPARGTPAALWGRTPALGGSRWLGGRSPGAEVGQDGDGAVTTGRSSPRPGTPGCPLVPPAARAAARGLWRPRPAAAWLSGWASLEHLSSPAWPPPSPVQLCSTETPGPLSEGPPHAKSRRERGRAPQCPLSIPCLGGRARVGGARAVTPWGCAVLGLAARQHSPGRYRCWCRCQCRCQGRGSGRCRSRCRCWCRCR